MLILFAAAMVAIAGSPYDTVSGVSVASNATADVLAGTYYTGDGLGYNLHLTLAANGAFNCTWQGCLGVYGTATGAWTVAGSQIVLKPTKETDMLKDRPLRVLDVLVRSNQYIFVKADDNGFFLKHGPSEYSCFQREVREK